MIGGGGIIINPNGIQEQVYSCGLDVETNNVAEALALWKGLLQARNQGILDLTVIGDSRLIIQALVTSSLSSIA